MINRMLVVLSLFTFASSAASDDRVQEAIDLIDRMEEIYRGDTSKARLTMTIETPQYQRTLELESKNQGQDNSFIRILSPRKDRGIATLKLDQEMWNYFPKINKVIKVPPSMMMGSWMGSDFTNDDLVKQTTLTEEYDLSLEETDDEYQIILVPKAQTVTVWGKIDYIVDKARMIPIAQNFYDDDGTMVRRMEFREPVNFSGKLLPSVLEMVPLNKEGHRTLVRYDLLEFDPTDVTTDDFTLRNLKSRF